MEFRVLNLSQFKHLHTSNHHLELETLLIQCRGTRINIKNLIYKAENAINRTLSLYIFLFNSNILIGFCRLYPLSDIDLTDINLKSNNCVVENSILISLFVINKDYRRQGYGKHLIMYILTHIHNLYISPQSMKIPSLLLEVQSDNHAAINLYSTCGFKTISTYRRYNDTLILLMQYDVSNTAP